MNDENEYARRIRRIQNTLRVAANRRNKAIQMGRWDYLNEDPPRMLYDKQQISQHSKACYLCNYEKYFNIPKPTDIRRMPELQRYNKGQMSDL